MGSKGIKNIKREFNNWEGKTNWKKEGIKKKEEYKMNWIVNL